MFHNGRITKSFVIAARYNRLMSGTRGPVVQRLLIFGNMQFPGGTPLASGILSSLDLRKNATFLDYPGFRGAEVAQPGNEH